MRSLFQVKTLCISDALACKCDRLSAACHSRWRRGFFEILSRHAGGACKTRDAAAHDDLWSRALLPVGLSNLVTPEKFMERRIRVARPTTKRTTEQSVVLCLVLRLWFYATPERVRRASWTRKSSEGLHYAIAKLSLCDSGQVDENWRNSWIMMVFWKK